MANLHQTSGLGKAGMGVAFRFRKTLDTRFRGYDENYSGGL